MEAVAVPGLTGMSRRRAGAAATAAGVIGVLAFGLLVAALFTRSQAPAAAAVPLFRGQDIAVALQALLMVPVTLALRGATRGTGGPHRATGAIGLAGHLGVALSVVLVLSYRAHRADMLYMLPLGLVGIWLVLLCWLTGEFSKKFRVFGVVAGVGLVTIAGAAAIIAQALGWQIMNFTESPSVEPAAISSTGNRIGHLLLPIGTLLGRALYPIWTIGLGWNLLRRTEFGVVNTQPKSLM